MKKVLLFVVLAASCQAFGQSGKSEFIKDALFKTDIGTSVSNRPLWIKFSKNIDLGTYEGGIIRANAGDSVKIVDIYTFNSSYIKWISVYKSNPYYVEINESKDFLYDQSLMDDCKKEAIERVKIKAQKIKADLERTLTSLYGKKIAKYVLEKKVELDMPKDAVFSSWGSPDKETVIKKKSGTYEMLYYYDKKSLITVLNGKVTEITTTN